MSTKGIDLSYHNGNVDFDKVKNAGYDFVMLRVGYRGWQTGGIEKDTKFEDYYNRAIRSGLAVGVYFFSQAITTKEAVAERDFVLKSIEGKQLLYPVAFDTEPSGAYDSKGNGIGRADKLDRNQRSLIAKAFCTRIEDAGYYAIIYASESFFANNLYTDQLSRFDKWIANWSKRPSTFKWSYGMWQSSNKGSVSGVTGSVDINLSYTDYPSIMIKKGLNHLSKRYDVKISHCSDEFAKAIGMLCNDNNVEYIITETR